MAAATSAINSAESALDEVKQNYQFEADDELGDRPPLAMLEALCLRVNLNNAVSMVP
jgi:hypothetical protein